MAIDPPGTCHLVGCPDKGLHAPHYIGAPNPEDWDRTYGRKNEGGKAAVTISQEDAAYILDRWAEFKFRDLEQSREVLHRVSRALAQARNS